MSETRRTKDSRSRGGTCAATKTGSRPCAARLPTRLTDRLRPALGPALGPALRQAAASGRPCARLGSSTTGASASRPAPRAPPTTLGELARRKARRRRPKGKQWRRVERKSRRRRPWLQPGRRQRFRWTIDLRRTRCLETLCLWLGATFTRRAPMTARSAAGTTLAPMSIHQEARKAPAAPIRAAWGAGRLLSARRVRTAAQAAASAC